MGGTVRETLHVLATSCSSLLFSRVARRVVIAKKGSPNSLGWPCRRAQSGTVAGRWEADRTLGCFGSLLFLAATVWRRTISLCKPFSSSTTLGLRTAWQMKDGKLRMVIMMIITLTTDYDSLSLADKKWWNVCDSESMHPCCRCLVELC